MSKRTCDEPGCGKPHRARGLCSTHYNQQKPDRHVHRITCDWCGRDHQTSRSNSRYCSRECYGAMLGYKTGTNVCGLSTDHPARKLQFLRTTWPSCRVFFTTCVVCSELFATPYTVSTCGDACAEAKRRDDKREGDHRRRALLRDAFVAPVVRREIFERDRWRCHICSKLTKRTALVPDPLAPTLDHVIPLASGGTHEPANVRTAHYRCNSVKGDRGGNEQLMLIG